jgi:hypothetical protein
MPRYRVTLHHQYYVKEVVEVEASNEIDADITANDCGEGESIEKSDLIAGDTQTWAIEKVKDA